MGRELPSRERLLELFDYDREKGRIYRKARDSREFRATRHQTAEHRASNWNSNWAGKEAGGLDDGGYIRVSVAGARYRLHRIIWKLEHARDPHYSIDHIDGDKLNNHYSNLRDVSALENSKNAHLRKHNKSGVSGVRFKQNRWMAQIGTTGSKGSYLGCFKTKEEAVQARQAAEQRLGYSARHGKHKREEV